MKLSDYQLAKTSIKLSENLWKFKYNSFFKNQKRVYLNINNDIDYLNSGTYKRVNNRLQKLGYTVNNYIEGKATKEKNVYKIGKLLKDYPALQNAFRDDECRQKVTLVISRHPYDIAKASVGRSWESCLNYNSGAYNEYTHAMIKNNSILIAYYIRSSDKNIKNPLGRILIYPYYNFENGEKWLTASNSAYGIFPKFIKKSLQDYLDAEINYPALKMNTKTLRLYFKFSHDLYSNSDKKYFSILNPNVMKNRKLIREMIYTGKLKDILNLSTQQDIFNNSLLKSEFEKYFEYFNDIQASVSKYNENKSFYDFCWNNKLNEKCFSILKMARITITRNEEMEENLIKDNSKLDKNTFEQIYQYSKLLKDSVVWVNGRKKVDEYFNSCHRKPRQKYLDLCKKIRLK